MSQKKVDRYKTGKSSRAKAARKEKIIDRLEILAWIVIAVAMVAWVGYSAYVKLTATDSTEVVTTTFDNTALDNYLSNLDAEESTEDTTEDATEETTEDAAEDATEETTEDTAEDAAEETAEDTTEAATEDTSEDTAEDTTADTADTTAETAE